MADKIVKSPSPKQLELLRHLCRFQQKHGYAPTLDELGRSLGVSKVTVHQYTRSLERKGLVSRLRNRARSLQVTEAAKALDLFGAHPAPWKLVGELHPNGKLKFFPAPRKVEPDVLVQRYRNVNLLKISGHSLDDKNIRDGDYLLIEPLREKHHHQLGLVQSPEGKVELYKFLRKHGRLYIPLEGQNHNLILVQPTDILGVVVGLIRTY